MCALCQPSVHGIYHQHTVGVSVLVICSPVVGGQPRLSAVARLDFVGPMSPISARVFRC